MCTRFHTLLKTAQKQKQAVRTVVVVQQVYSMTRRGWIVVKVYRVPATNSPRDSVNDLPVPPQSCCSIQYQGYRGAETADSSIVPRVPGGAEMTVFSPAPKVSGGETTGTGRPGTLKACVYVCVRDECVCSAQQETHFRLNFGRQSASPSYWESQWCPPRVPAA